jgi:hypothetical protein
VARWVVVVIRRSPVRVPASLTPEVFDCPLPVILWEVAPDVRGACNQDLRFLRSLTG